MYAQARTQPVYWHRRANNQAHLNMFKGCAFSNEPCDCIKSLELGDLSINKYKKVEYIPVAYPPTSEILAQIDQIEVEIQKELAALKEMLQ